MRLWHLGDARIVVNEAPSERGLPVVAAIGFVVDDPQRSAARAQTLGAPRVDRRTEADEQLLQAVRAPDGTEIFFCSSSSDWIAEFAVEDGDPRATGSAQPGAPSRPGAAGTLGAEPGDGCRVDHINLDQPWQRQEEGLLFLSAVLSLAPLPSLDVASPLGLVRSQVMRSDDGAVRLALNVAPPMVRRAGPGLGQVQHIAVSCPDLIAFARRAQARGLPFLRIPDNYYDDLQARLDLPSDTLATLRDLNLLYDRDSGGEFLHFYTATVGEVFLEVVQRIGHYDGYGAPNAPVRLATQHADRA